MRSRIIPVMALVGAFAAIGPATVSAQGFQTGRWQFHVVTQLPNAKEVVAGVQLPPNVHVSQNGMTVDQTICLNSDDPSTELSKPRGPDSENAQCRIDRLDRSPGMVSWQNTCTMPTRTERSIGWARYNGGQMEAQFNKRTVPVVGNPIDSVNNVSGRYLGACTGG